MERLTYFDNGRWMLLINGVEYTGFPFVDRLAAYEDAMSIDRAQELAQAEKDGRLVVLPPPNAPLTMEELREMDGEPVYVIFTDGHQGWAILDIWAKSNDSCVTLYGPDMESYEEQRLDFLNTNGEGQAGYDGWKAYRRKPEEETT